MKKIIIIVVVGFALYAAYWIADGFFDELLHRNQTQQRSHLSLAEIAKHANATLPKQIDSNTRLDQEIAGPSNRMTYQYTLINVSVANVDTAKFTETLRPELIKAYKTNPGLASYRDRQVELQYEYRDKAGQPVTTILVSPKDF